MYSLLGSAKLNGLDPEAYLSHVPVPHPIYLGMLLVYGGIGIAVRSSSILILTLPLAIAIRYGVVAREEAYLERRFADTYRDYKARVRRWV
jgi:protein-S-isoprenylcysteine O-methyltransferase Ste14